MVTHKKHIKLIFILITALAFIILLLTIFVAVATWFDGHKIVFHAPIEVKLFTPVKVEKRVEKLISPLAVEAKEEVKELSLTLSQAELDKWIGECADKFANKNKTASMLRYQLHCLANKETGHKATLKCGDSGLSCGLYQYKQATWLGFRNLMKKEGLITDISSRDDDKQAVFTTAWALAGNRDGNWGPWIRGECQ